MRLLRLVWKLFVMAAVFGVGYVVGREHSFEEEEQWEAENKKNNENANGEKAECNCCGEKVCDCCKDETAAVANEVTFEYENDKATKVALVGPFNNWNKDADLMTKENSVWKCTKKLESGSHEYQFVIDDTDWVVDPKADNNVNNKYEGQNSVVVVK